MAFTTSTTWKNTGLTAQKALLDSGGTLRFYSGAVPANADASLGAAVQIASCALSSTAFGAASGGVITANAISPATVSPAGTPTFARLYSSGGACHGQATVGPLGSGADILLNATSFSAGAPLRVLSNLTVTQP